LLHDEMHVVVAGRDQQWPLFELARKLQQKVGRRGRVAFRIWRTDHAQVTRRPRRRVRFGGQPINVDRQACEASGNAESGVVGVQYDDGSRRRGHGPEQGILWIGLVVGSAG
jgi:hypothetical protein